MTGGAGFIGTHLCAALRAEPRVDSVVVLDDLSAGSTPPTSDVEFVQGSVLDAALVAAALVGADAVVHLAARSAVSDSMRDPLDTYRVNGLGSAVVFEVARRHKLRLAVLASSAAVYGDAATVPISEDAATRPVNPYGASKLAAEAYALAAQHAFGLPVLVLRPFNVYGPGQLAGGQDGAVLPIFLDAAARGAPLPVNGDGEQTRDFVYVRDLCQLITGAVLLGRSAPMPVNVGRGVPTSLRELVETLADVLDRPLECAFRPPRPGDIRHSHADPTALHRLFPDFAPVTLRAGLAATVHYEAGERLAGE